MIYYYSFTTANNLLGSSSFEAEDDTQALRKIRSMYYGSKPRSRYLPDNILVIYTEKSSELVRGKRENKFRIVWKKFEYRPEWEKPVHNVYKHLPTLAKNWTGTYTYPEGASVEYVDSTTPTVVRYSNGESIKIINGEVVEIRTFDAIDRHARDFAMEAHGEQTYGDKPYMYHLTVVHTILSDFGFGGNLAVASWLHDVVEDTTTTKEDIEREFGSVVAEYVWSVTGVGKTRHARNESMYEKLRKNIAVIPLKLADRIANVESAQQTNYNMLMLYRREQISFEGVLKPLRNDLAPMWERLRHAMWTHYQMER